MGPARPRLEWLEFGRGVAAIAVVLCHTRWFLIQTPNYLHFVDPWGDWGVAFFFVLSGFIIYFVHFDDLGRPQQAGGFVSRRFFRIFPTYWLILTGALIARQYLGNPDYVLHIDAIFIVVNALLLPEGSLWINVAWSLRFELLFYLVFLVAIINLRVGMILAAAWLLLAIVTFVQFGMVNRNASIIGIAKNHLTFYFLIGVVIAEFSRRKKTPVAIVLSLAFVAGTVLWNWLDSYESSVSALQLAVAALLVSVAVYFSEVGIPAPPLSKWLGEISYPLYLLHIPAMTVTHGIFKKLSAAPEPWYISVTVSFTLMAIAATLISKFYERPLLRMTKSAQPTRRIWPIVRCSGNRA